jgi:Protein kinase domain
VSLSSGSSSTSTTTTSLRSAQETIPGTCNRSTTPSLPNDERVNTTTADEAQRLVSNNEEQNRVAPSTTNENVRGALPSDKDNRTMPHEATNILNKVNMDFLPLIQESNMIRVNHEPYVKLGVIGKGGSCKVYRALSKDCSVLAIKRIKTDDLDKKAIDGYANEIALLKRLRGNPAIIQLHDSEVDMTRQVILLVMEAGEADLNHVLQRQTLGQGSGNERSLNMNFIRLTWQVRHISSLP